MKVEMSEIIQIITNNGVAVAVIVYFMIRDYKFIGQLTKSIQELIDSVKGFEQIYKGRGENDGT